MKYIVLVIIFFISLYADIPSKVWTITDSNNIESTEDDFVPPPVDDEIQYIAKADIPNNPLANGDINLDDIPLAQTFPVDDEPTQLETTKRLSSDEDLEKRIKEIQGMIEKSVAEQKQLSTSKTKSIDAKDMQNHSDVGLDTTINTSSKNDLNLDTVKDDSSDIIQTGDEPFSFSFLVEQPKMLALLLAAIGGLMTVLFLMFRSKDPISKQDKVETITTQKVELDNLAMDILLEYEILKGRIHGQFLERKENILFHDEFTPYQKAKATLELEKQYNNFEHIQLPKLFSDDFSQFIEAEAILSDTVELKDMMHDFIKSRMQNRQYTREQEKILESKIGGHYKVDKPAKKDSTKSYEKDDETAYFLQ